MNGRILVCSVFAGGERDRFWFRLQREQLQLTTGEFDHAVHLGHRAESADYEGSTIVGQCGAGQFEKTWEEHLWGLIRLSNYCRQRPDYDGYLVLDSDAFPVAPGWSVSLSNWLDERGKRYAAAFRLENLDAFAHPCVVYTRDPRTLVFGRKEHTNLLGKVFTDVTCLTEEPLPLIRTNARSVHPVLASIYLGLFYHHGCGSRVFSTRAMKSGYYSHLVDSSSMADPVFEELRRAPAEFLAMLTAGYRDRGGVPAEMNATASG